jgi:hypothetical protein
MKRFALVAVVILSLFLYLPGMAAAQTKSPTPTSN